ncbi:MAG: hypothetical protein IPK19_27995 [Chloroflexi bacterium]|nr:hypothetical protein [Chloroflexota bacterium]
MIPAILDLLLRNRTVLIDLAFDIVQHIPLITRLPGIYEVISYEAELELQDTRGRKAIYRKRQVVRFIQDNIIAYQDTAWGDGDIFAQYRCSPGIEVDRYREGHRYNILISLRSTKSRGDVETLQIERAIRDGFTAAVEEFQVEVDHRTRHFSFSLIIPGRQMPRRVTLIEQKMDKTTSLGSEHKTVLPDGRQRFTWTSERPRLFEAYILRWEW